MLLKTFSIRDAKSTTFTLVNAFINRAVALRWFGDLCKNPQSDMAKHPEDYDLFESGEYDDETGKLFPYSVGPQHVAKAIDYVVTESDVPLRQVQ